MECVDEYPHEKSEFAPTTVEYCSSVDLSAEDTRE